MGYACPVCDAPQADASHLANHLAFTALLHGDDHEAWLDEHVPEWESTGERGLARRVRAFAADAAYPKVFEDTAGGLDGDHDHDPATERSGALFDDDAAPSHGALPRTADAAGRDELDEETRAILEEARNLTRRMLEEPDTVESAIREADDPPGDDDSPS